MVKRIIFILFVVSIIIVLGYYIFHLYISYKIKLMLEKYGVNSKNFVLPSESLGLIIDAKIIYDSVPNINELLGKRKLIIENTPDSYKEEDLILVNLDCTDFNKLRKPNSPTTILCKTKQCYDILKTNMKNKNIIYTGFTSIDRFKPGHPMDYNMFIHVCGKSPFKGTLQLVKIWLNHPEFPTLNIKAYSEIQDKIKALLKTKPASNIILNSSFSTENDIDILYNTYGIHLCTSEHEGWGHYIAEAKACKAVVLYTDAPCMNETFIDGYDGIAIKCNSLSTLLVNELCPSYDIQENDLVDAVKRVIALSTDEKQIIGENARKRYLENDIQFKNRIVNIF